MLKVVGLINRFLAFDTQCLAFSLIFPRNFVRLSVKYPGWVWLQTTVSRFRGLARRDSSAAGRQVTDCHATVVLRVNHVSCRCDHFFASQFYSADDRRFVGGTSVYVPDLVPCCAVLKRVREECCTVLYLGVDSRHAFGVRRDFTNEVRTRA